MKKTKKALTAVTIILLVAVVFIVFSVALDLQKLFKNKDEDYEFVQGPGGDISEPPPEGNLDDVVDWEEEPEGDGDVDDNVTYVIDPSRVNVLLVGVDKRPGSKRAPLSDSIMIFSFHKKTGNPVLLSIPRDTYVKIPGRRMDKINHSHAFGGVALLRKSVEEFTKIPIHYYLRVNFEGFAGIVDMLGGVEIYVDKDISPLKKGTQVLNGANALAYCRFRKDSKGDFGRAERQQRFFVATAKQVQRKALHKLPALIKEGVRYVDTDMPLLTALDFANEFSKLDTDAVVSHVVTGRGFYYKGVYYSQPKIAAMREFIAKYLAI